MNSDLSNFLFFQQGEEGPDRGQQTQVHRPDPPRLGLVGRPGHPGLEAEAPPLHHPRPARAQAPRREPRRPHPQRRGRRRRRPPPPGQRRALPLHLGGGLRGEHARAHRPDVRAADGVREADEEEGSDQGGRRDRAHGQGGVGQEGDRDGGVVIGIQCRGSIIILLMIKGMSIPVLTVQNKCNIVFRLKCSSFQSLFLPFIVRLTDV